MGHGLNHLAPARTVATQVHDVPIGGQQIARLSSSPFFEELSDRGAISGCAEDESGSNFSSTQPFGLSVVNGGIDETVEVFMNWPRPDHAGSPPRAPANGILGGDMLLMLSATHDRASVTPSFNVCYLYKNGR